MIEIVFSVDRFFVTKLTQTDIVSGSKNFLQFRFVFSSEWDGLNKTPKITTGGKTYNCALAGNIILPENAPILEAGECAVSVVGTNGDGVVVYTASSNTFYVSQAADEDGEDPVPIPASYGAQILSAVEARTITSPNGTVYKLKVTDNGELYTEAV